MLIVCHVVGASCCCEFVMLFPLLLIHCVTCFVVGSFHCWFYCWFLALPILLLLDHCVISLAIGSSHCWCSWFIVLLVLLLVCCVIGSQIPPKPPCYCSFALFFYIVGCYSFCLSFGEVVFPLSSPCRWLVSGPSHCYTCPITRYPPSPFTPGLLFGVVVTSLCWWCRCWFVVLFLSCSHCLV